MRPAPRADLERTLASHPGDAQCIKLATQFPESNLWNLNHGIARLRAASSQRWEDRFGQTAWAAHRAREKHEPLEGLHCVGQLSSWTGSLSGSVEGSGGLLIRASCLDSLALVLRRAISATASKPAVPSAKATLNTFYQRVRAPMPTFAAGPLDFTTRPGSPSATHARCTLTLPEVAAQTGSQVREALGPGRAELLKPRTGRARRSSEAVSVPSPGHAAGR